MKCPSCQDQDLTSKLTKRGVEVDLCPACGGIWLDKGEIFHFCRDASALSAKLDEALRDPLPGDRPSPRSGNPMAKARISESTSLDYCRDTGGLWLGGEVRDGGLGLDLAEDPVPVVAEPPEPVAAGSVPLLRLPNLAFRSVATLGLLYGVLILSLITASLFLNLTPELALAAGLVGSLIHFALGPFLMDLSLRFFYRIRWQKPDELPPHLRAFVQSVCHDKGIRFPRFGLIEDGAPQAFTYGHTPNSARIVISQGLLTLLEPEEAEAVVAHEIGHAVHWDMFLMTVAQLVPLIMYYLYRAALRAKSSSKKGNSGRLYVALGAYLLYLVSQYLVLWFSRTREYHADRFAGDVTGHPSRLAQALVKIAYGLAGREPQDNDAETAKPKHKGGLDAIGALGIFDPQAAQSLAIASYSAASDSVEADNFSGAMRWDLWNPWARWYELNSTHPLVAKRLQFLSNQAAHLGGEPFVVIPKDRPESYWDEFVADLAIHLLPLAAALIAAVAVFLTVPAGSAGLDIWLGSLALAVGPALLIRFYFTYKGTAFPEMSVAALLKQVKVSAVRPVPCTLTGEIIGRGMPGYIFSEDFVLRDQTGIIFLDYRQPLRLWEFLFGLLKAGDYTGRTVTAEGWYRRAPMPYLEVRKLTMDGKTRKSWAPAANLAFAFCLALAGIVLLAFQPIGGDFSLPHILPQIR